MTSVILLGNLASDDAACVICKVWPTASATFRRHSGRNFLDDLGPRVKRTRENRHSVDDGSDAHTNAAVPLRPASAPRRQRPLRNAVVATVRLVYTAPPHDTRVEVLEDGEALRPLLEESSARNASWSRR